MREVLYNMQNRMQKAKQNIEGITQAMQVSDMPQPPHQAVPEKGPLLGGEDPAL